MAEQCVTLTTYSEPMRAFVEAAAGRPKLRVVRRLG